MQCDILVVPHQTVWIFYICLMLENVINFTIYCHTVCSCSTMGDSTHLGVEKSPEQLCIYSTYIHIYK